MPFPHARTVAAVLFAITTTSATALAQSATDKASRAETVKSSLTLQLESDGKTIDVAVDDGQPVPLKKDQVFLTKRWVQLSFYRMNPLRYIATAGVTDADDPDQATIAKLIDALLAVVETVKPGIQTEEATNNLSAEFVRRAPDGTLPEACSELTAASTLASTLDTNLFDEVWLPSTIKKALADWDGVIDSGLKAQRSGPSVVGDVARDIGQWLVTKQIEQKIERAANAIKELEAHLAENANAAANQTQQACRETTRGWYRMLHLTNPAGRLTEIKRIEASIRELQALLANTYANDNNWAPQSTHTSYILKRIVEPTREKMQTVAVKVAKIDYSKLDEVTPVVVAKSEEVASASFTVRKHSLLIPEVGVGATFARLPRPKYATTTNPDTGKTVVDEVTVEETTVDPTVMVNFVCRCDTILTPMFQLGASTDKDHPAIFIGGGVRLFHSAKGDFGIGYGYVNAWVKQLQKLKPGDVVSGQAALDKDLKFQRLGDGKAFDDDSRWHHYINLQYKFGL